MRLKLTQNNRDTTTGLERFALQLMKQAKCVFCINGNEKIFSAASPENVVNFMTASYRQLGVHLHSFHRHLREHSDANMRSCLLPLLRGCLNQSLRVCCGSRSATSKQSRF